VRLSTVNEWDIDLPVSMTPPKGLAVSSPLPERLHSRVRGAGWQILLMNFTRNSRYQFDLADRVVPENMPVVLHSDEVMHAAMTPSEVRVLKVEPDSIVVTFSKRTEKRVPIAPLTDITPGPGYVLVGSPVASPATVMLSGASTILDSIRTFPTALVIAHDAKQDVDKSVPLSDSLDNYVTIEHETPITVHADIQAIGERTMQGLLTGVDALPPTFDVILIPNRVSATLRGGVDKLAALKPTELRVHIPFDPVVFDTARSLAPIVEGPEGVELLSVDPPRLKFIIRRKPVTANAHR
jgi:hypothetical protein